MVDGGLRYGSTAWKGLNAGAKAMAATAIDLMTKPDELEKLRKEFEAYFEETPLQVVPAGRRQPPLDMYKELMDKYRGLLEKALR